MHVHPVCKEATWENTDKEIVNAFAGSNKKARRLWTNFTKIVKTKVSIEDFIKLMDNFGIDKAVIVSFNIQTAYGVKLVTNGDIAKFVRLHPNRFIGFGCIDIPAPDAMDQLEYAIESLNLKGIKLVPPVQKFDISDKKYDLIWKKMVDLNVPLWTHAGHQVSTAGSIAKFGHPMLIDDMIMRNKDLKLIIGHMGTPWFWDTYSVVLRHLNTYVDISAHYELYNYFPWDAYTKYQIEDKVLFGSDHPLVHWNKILPAVKSLPISESFKDKILFQNAKKLLNL
jgi:predicted TIM-barrel fold metal-dependent hydrolase